MSRLYQVADYVRIKGTAIVTKIDAVQKDDYGTPIYAVSDGDGERFFEYELEPATEREYLDAPVSIGGDVVRKEDILNSLPPRPMFTGMSDPRYVPQTSWHRNLADEFVKSLEETFSPLTAPRNREMRLTLRIPIANPLGSYLEEVFARVLQTDCTFQTHPGPAYKNDYEIARSCIFDPQDRKGIMQQLWPEKSLLVMAAQSGAYGAQKEEDVLEHLWDTEAYPRLTENWVGPWGERVGCAQRHWQSIRRTIYDHGFDAERALDIAAWFKQCPIELDPTEFATMPFCTDLILYDEWETWLYNQPW